MGVVYKAEDTKLDRPVALKFLAPHLLRDEEGRKRFEREAKAAAKLDHPNICTVYEIDEADGRTFIAMAFLEGRTLSKKIADGPLKLSEALSIAIQMADGLEAAHEKGIVHRDIKPDNVMLMKGSRGLVKLMDFGLAQLAESSKLTREGTTLGTPIYMSPEQALGEPTDGRSDVWGFGVVLYEMVAGQPPFTGEVDQAVIYAIANERHEPLTGLRTGVPKELERIADKCLAKDADERYQHVTDLLVDLQACRGALEPGKQKEALTAVPGRWMSPSGWGVAAVVLLAIAATAWWFGGAGEREAGPPEYRYRQITRDTGYTADPTLSPNGQLLAYSSDRGGDGNLDIWVQQLTGGEPIQLTQHQADDYAPSFSPDGSRIVFRSARGGQGIYVVPALGGDARRIVDRGRFPRYSPDGQWVSYSTDSDINANTGLLSRIGIVPASGGSQRMVETDVSAALAPIWSPDGKYFLFQGSREPARHEVTVTFDWWVVSVEGGEAVSLGMRELLENAGIRLARNPRERPRPMAWLADGNRVLFSAAIVDGGENVWQVRLRPSNWSIAGGIQRLTSGVGEQDPSASQDGRFAFVSATLDWDIWSLPLDANRAEVLGEPESVVSGLSNDLHPSVSADGRRLAYVSDRSGNNDIWLRDLESSEDRSVTIGPDNEGCGTISPDGSKVAFVRSARGDDVSNDMYVRDLAQETETRLVEDMGNMFDWMPDGERILYYTPPPLRWKTANVETGEQVEIELKHPESAPHTLRFSPNGDLIAFNLPTKTSGEWLIFVARLRNGRPTEYDEWIQITENSFAGYPWWSPDGNTLYFRSSRDGFDCIWAQPLDTVTKKPQGPLKGVRHFHGRVRAAGGGRAGYGMTSDRLYLPLSEPKANIWLAESVEE